MQKKEDGKQEAVPVMKRLARPMSQKELQDVKGARNGSAPSWNATSPYRPSDWADQEF
jgi:hypothetical protein